jgi:hypothetical protein
MPDFYAITIDCECCLLPQRLRDRDGAVPTICDTCAPHHGGKLPGRALARAESHEAMLRERLAACRRSEDRAQAAAANDKERVAAALSSRGSLAARIVSASSSERSHRCAAQAIGHEPEVIRFAQEHASRLYGGDDE